MAAVDGAERVGRLDRRLPVVAGRIRDEDVATVKERANIADVVGEYVTLRNAGGGSMKGLCPFHDEKSPSFNVTPARGYFYCFGCQASGDVISFLTQLEHLSFTEAVERLADRVGSPAALRGRRVAAAGAAPGQRQRLLAAHKAAAEFYAEQLESAGCAGRAQVFVLSRFRPQSRPSTSASATPPAPGRRFAITCAGGGSPMPS